MRFICSQHPKRKGKSLDARLRTESIGISPLRLLYGRAASYGSIINPCIGRRHLQEQLGLLLYKSLSLASFWKVLALLQPRLGFPRTRNVSNECIFNFQGSMRGIFEFGTLAPHLMSKKRQKVNDFLKNFFKNTKNSPFASVKRV